jgi:hypothetical protein
MNKDQLALINTIFAAFGIEANPDISKGATYDLLKAFEAFTKGSSKGSSKKSKKVKDPNAPKRPFNAYFAWLALNRALLKAQNGGSEDGLADLLKSEYEKFKQTPAYQKLKKECEEKMKVYKEEMSEASASESPSEDEDDSKGKKKTTKKAPKVEKSPEEKQPPNVYMTYRNVHLQRIKENLKEGENLAEVLKEKYEEFKSTKEYNALQEKCKADFAKWKSEKSGSDSDEAPKKKTAAKKKAEVEVTSDSDDDDDTFTMPKPKAVPEKVPEKTQPKKEKNKKKAAKKVDSDDDE